MREDIRLTEIKMNARTHGHVNKMLVEKDAEIARLKEALDCATNNQWAEWELERGEVKGENMSLIFKVAELQAENAALKEKVEKIRNWRMKESKACRSYYDWNEFWKILDDK